MDLYIDETGVYYCPNGDGNANLAVAGNGDVWWSDLGLYAGDLTTVDETWQSTRPEQTPGHDLFFAYEVTYADGTKVLEPPKKINW